jgi:probable HAF family extracellular repeat protein
MRILLTSLTIFTALCSSSAPVVAGNIEYTITDLGVLSSAPSNGGSHPTAMNSAGEVVGYGDIYTDYSHAFVYAGSGPLVNLGSFGGDYNVSIATGINNSGMVIGYSGQAGSSPSVAFLYTQRGGMQTLGPVLGNTTSYAWGLNNNDQIVGYYGPASGGVDGFIYNAASGSMIDLGAYLPLCINDAGLVGAVVNSGSQESAYVSSGGTGTWVNIGSLGGTNTTPYAINSSGEVVGGSSIDTASENRQPFVYSGGSMTGLGTFGGQAGLAYAINDEGVVVGSADLTGDLTGHAFVYYGNGTIQDLNNLVDPSLGWTILGAVAINDNGQIAAEAYQHGGYDHGILLTPTTAPEPSSLWLLFGAILGVTTIQLGARLLTPRRNDNTSFGLTNLDLKSENLRSVQSCFGYGGSPGFSRRKSCGLSASCAAGRDTCFEIGY